MKKWRNFESPVPDRFLAVKLMNFFYIFFSMLSARKEKVADVAVDHLSIYTRLSRPPPFPLFSSILLFFFSIFKSEEFNVSGISFQWTDGLFGMSIAPSNDGYSVMYFHPLSSTMEYSVSTKILRDSERANSPGKSIYFNIVSSIS